MSRGPAQTMQKKDLDVLLHYVDYSNKHPLDIRVAFLLSFTAMLRVAEIAGLTWRKNMLGPDGEFQTQEFLEKDKRGRVRPVRYPVLFVDADIGKYGRKRTIRIHPTLLLALKELMLTADLDGHVIPSAKSGARQGLRARAHALKMRLNRIYTAAGYEECSTHTGRRTGITNMARKANLYGCSLRDVQEIAGHGHLTTTQSYIEISDQQAGLIASVFD